MYAKCFKRLLDFFVSFLAILILSPIFILLTIVGTIVMKGNPFFVQARPGRKRKNGEERIFRLLKFRTMNAKKDADGNLLPDEDRLNKYGRFLRATSLDELPELFNIFKGDMSIVGPRPLLVAYLDRYTQEQRRRHDVRPGLTGFAQAYGRNGLTWEEKFTRDVYYVDNLSFVLDLKILFKTVTAVFKREGISSESSATMEEFMGQANDKEE